MEPNSNKNYMDFYNKIKEGLLVMVKSNSNIDDTNNIAIYSSSFSNLYWFRLMIGISKLSYKLINNVYMRPEYAIFILLCDINSHTKEHGTYRISWKSNRKLDNLWKSDWILKYGFPLYISDKYISAYIDESFIYEIFTYNNVLLLIAFEIDIIIENRST